MQNELKPCPFCNGEAKLLQTRECWGMGMFDYEWYVECSQCGVKGKEASEFHNKTKEECISEVTEKWNRRVDNAE